MQSEGLVPPEAQQVFFLFFRNLFPYSFSEFSSCLPVPCHDRAFKQPCLTGNTSSITYRIPEQSRGLAPSAFQYLKPGLLFKGPARKGGIRTGIIKQFKRCFSSNRIPGIQSAFYPRVQKGAAFRQRWFGLPGEVICAHCRLRTRYAVPCSGKRGPVG